MMGGGGGGGSDDKGREDTKCTRILACI